MKNAIVYIPFGELIFVRHHIQYNKEPIRLEIEGVFTELMQISN